MLCLFALYCQMPFWECYAPRGQNSLLLLSPQRIPAREQVILSHNQISQIFTDFSLTLGVTGLSGSYSLTSPRTLTIQTTATNCWGHFCNEGSQLSRQCAAKTLSPIDPEWMLLKPPNFLRFPYWFHEEHGPADTLLLDFQGPELWDSKFLLFQSTLFVVLSYGSSRKWI